jgi:anti-anti-sigma regulatory factor
LTFAERAVDDADVPQRGEVTAVSGLPAEVHLCWPFWGRRDFVAAAARFLRDGLCAGLRVELVARGPALDAVRATEHLADAAHWEARGALRLTPLEYAYAASGSFSEARQIDDYVAAVDEAVRDGFAGYRVAADVTALVMTPETRDVFAGYEQAIGRALMGKPFSAMCAFDRKVLNRHSIAEVACVHPVMRAGSAAFSLSPAPWGATLRGELDVSTEELFSRTLARMPVAGDEEIVDVAGVRYMDHRAMLAFGRRARDARAKIVLRNGTPVMSELVEMLELAGVSVEVSL